MLLLVELAPLVITTGGFLLWCLYRHLKVDRKGGHKLGAPRSTDAYATKTSATGALVSG